MKMSYNLFFIPLLLIAAAAVWFVTQKEQADQAAKRIADRALVNFETLDVIEITHGDQNIRLERQNKSGNASSNWKITHPYRAGCNPQAVNDLIDGLMTTEIDRDIEGITDEQKVEYGLTDPVIRIVLTASGSQMMDLSIGEENASGSSMYGSFADDPLNCFLLPIYSMKNFELTADQLRDPHAIVFNKENLVSIQLSSVNTEVEIDRINNNWIVHGESDFSASPARLDILFHDLTELAAAEFLPEGETDPELNQVSTGVHLENADGSSINLFLHGEDYSRGIFATSDYQPTPFIVEAYIYDRLALNPEVFFHILLIDVSTDQIERVLIRQPSVENLEIKRTGSRDGDWEVLRPAGIKTVNAALYTDIINTLIQLEPEENIPAPDRPDDYGLAPSYFMKIEVYPKDDSGLESVQIYVGNKMPSGGYIATADSMTYFTINADYLAQLIEKVDAIRLLPSEE
ncbi:MAG TPA: DUF4340 domain-containing protein [bacterium]|jgi:hypothetical protein